LFEVRQATISLGYFDNITDVIRLVYESQDRSKIIVIDTKPNGSLDILRFHQDGKIANVACYCRKDDHGRWVTNKNCKYKDLELMQQ